MVKPDECRAYTVVFIQTHPERFKRRNLHRLLDTINGDKNVKIIFLIDNIEPLGRFKHEARVFDDILIGNFSFDHLIWVRDRKVSKN